MKDTFRSENFIKDINAPLLIVHGRQDNVIPFRFGEALFNLANEPKELVALDNGNHNDLYGNGAGEAVLTFLNKLRSDPDTPGPNL